MFKTWRVEELVADSTQECDQSIPVGDDWKWESKGFRIFRGAAES